MRKLRSKAFGCGCSEKLRRQRDGHPIVKPNKRPGKIVKAVASVAAAATMAMQPTAVAGVHDAPPLISFRNYQQSIFWDHTTKTLILHWSRQIGKSYTLAGWAVDRLLRYPGRLVTVLSNS